MRFLLVLFVCAFAAPAHADVGVGAAVGSADETILFPIRLSSMIIEPYFGYRDGDSGNTSTEAQTIGVGVFGSSTRGDNVSIYYGARLADVSQETSSTFTDPFTGLVIAQPRVEIDGYRVAPTFGFQYAISRVAIGAEIGWAYEEVDQTSDPPLSGISRTIITRGTRASVVFRFFF
jgi:hypothetical protein